MGRPWLQIGSGVKVPERLWMLSGGPDGEGVEVVGQHGPSDRCSGAVLAFEAGPPRAVAAFEVTDPPFAPDPVLREPAVGVPGSGGLSCGDEHALGVRERSACRAGVE